MRAGDLARARGVLASMRTAHGGRMPAIGVVAATMEVLGDREAAMALLAESIAKLNPWINGYVRAERFDRLRNDPRAAAMRDKVGSW